MGCTDGNRFDKAAVIYRLILESEESEAAFRYFLENADYIDSSNEKEADAYFTAQQLKKYNNEYSDLIDGLLNKLVMSHCNKEKFYEDLWESVMNSDLLFDTEDAKIYALGGIWSDGRIPYFHVKNGIKMSNDEFAEIIEDNIELLQETAFVLSCRFEQRTESGSMLVDLIERCSNDKEKAVLMANIIDLVEKRTLYYAANN